MEDLIGYVDDDMLMRTAHHWIGLRRIREAYAALNGTDRMAEAFTIQFSSALAGSTFLTMSFNCPE